MELMPQEAYLLAQKLYNEQASEVERWARSESIRIEDDVALGPQILQLNCTYFPVYDTKMMVFIVIPSSAIQDMVSRDESHSNTWQLGDVIILSGKRMVKVGSEGLCVVSFMHHIVSEEGTTAATT
ncbi:hypothetical protein VD0002_g9878 [Verticillium dahliae]|nr:hypothetical protein VD0002_g9878 [Verticillium dahliae]